jgi:hypothetical protein
MVAESLRRGGVEVVHEEFDDGHRDVNYRYDRSPTCCPAWLATRPRPDRTAPPCRSPCRREPRSPSSASGSG